MPLRKIESQLESSMNCFILRRSLGIVVSLIAALAVAELAQATNYTWNGFGDFDDATKWTPNGVPGINDAATFALNLVESVGLLQSHTIHNLTVSLGNFTYVPYGNGS